MNATEPRKIRGKILRILLAAAIAFVGILVLAAIFSPGRMDYISYWSAGKLLLHRANPYSPTAVLALQKAHGLPIERPRIMLNPPWALFLAAPLGLASIHIGLLLWTLADFGCILAAIRLLNIPSRDSIFALAFAPFLACLCSGQSSPFLLLGFSLFLCFHNTRPFLAGASLLLMAIKPHLFLIFWIPLMIDCIYRRRFQILTGFATALGAGTLFSMCFDINIWSHYFAMLRVYAPGQGYLPTISMLFRILIDIGAGWLMYVPTAVGILWSIWYYARRRQSWNWKTHGLLLMLVTILCSPYAWVSDEIVLLPAVAFGFTLSDRRKYSAWILLAINSAVVLIILFDHHASLTSPAYLWTPLAWLAWFLYATYKPGRRSEGSPAQFAELENAEQAG